MVKETVSNDNGTTVTEYTYDRNSNRLTKTVGGEVISYIYNELNQLASETGITYEYDLNGNLIKKTEAAQTTTYAYNAQNKLIRVTVQGGQSVNVEEYLYDYAGNRIAKVTELGSTYYLVDTNGALSQVLAEYDENGSLTTLYTRGDELISQERNGVKLYYLYDGFDSVRMLTDEGGSVTDTYTFDAFGNLTDSTGDTENSYFYRGEQFDTFTGLYYLRARYMNPSTGTFITMDEYAGSVFEPVSLHKYLYANANPVMNSDPTGYFSLSDMTASVGVQNVLNSMIYGAGMGAMLNSMLSALLTTLRGGTTEEIQQAFIDGMMSGFIMGGAFGCIGAYATVFWQARLLLAAAQFMGGYLAFRDALQDFQNGHCAAGVLNTGIGIMCAYGSAESANFANSLFVNSLTQQQDPVVSSLKQLESSGVKPGQTQISRSRIMEIVNNYDSTKAQSSIYNDGTSLYIVDGHHTTVATKILGRGTGANMGVPTQQVPSVTDVHWYKHWYEFWKKTIKVVD